MRLSVLDQSPIGAGEDAAIAIQHSIELAQLCDRLGYHRYWLAEHHNSKTLASSAPEILIGTSFSGVINGTGGVGGPNDFEPEYDFYCFNAVAGQSYSFYMQQAASIFGSTTGAWLKIYDADGNEVASG